MKLDYMYKVKSSIGNYPIFVSISFPIIEESVVNGRIRPLPDDSFAIDPLREKDPWVKGVITKEELDKHVMRATRQEMHTLASFYPNEFTALLSRVDDSHSLGHLNAHGHSTKDKWFYFITHDDCKPIESAFLEPSVKAWVVSACNPGRFKIEGIDSLVFYPQYGGTCLAERLVDPNGYSLNLSPENIPLTFDEKV